jgi:hypothetical protein
MATITSIQGLINTIATGEANTAERVRNAYNAILSQFFIGEVKWLKFTADQVLANFDSTGLGTSDAFLGWAVTNGENGTTNDDGKVSIAFGSVYSSLGAIGGSKDAVLIGHSHTLNDIGESRYGKNATDPGMQLHSSEGDSSDYHQTPIVTTSTAGGLETGVGKNMQPYVVELKIMRIA